MKKLFLFFMLVFAVTASFSQKGSDSVVSKNYYLKKSSNQKNWGWVLVSAGAGAIGIDIFANSFENDLSNAFNWFPEETPRSKNEKIVDGPVIAASLLVVAGGITLFVAADHNKKRAASLTLRNQPILFPQAGSFVVRPQPALSLKIGFNK